MQKRARFERATFSCYNGTERRCAAKKLGIGGSMSVEPAIPQHLRCPRTQASRMSVGYEAPYPAWMARFDEAAAPLIMAYFGVQHPRSLSPEALAPLKAM